MASSRKKSCFKAAATDRSRFHRDNPNPKVDSFAASNTDD